MALTQAQEEAKHQPRIAMMQSSIDNNRLNMKKLESDLRWESRKFTVSLFVGAAALLGAGAAIGNNFTNRTPIPAPAPQIIYLVPGQAPPKG